MKNFKIIALLLIVSAHFFVQAQQQAQPANVQSLQDNITAQAEAIKELVQTVNNLQNQLQKQAGTIEVADLELELQKLQQPAASPAQSVHQLVEVAKAQSKVLNQLAEVVLRLQHDLGIQPEGMQQALQQTS